MAVVRKLRCEVQKIVDHGSSVYTLELIPKKPLPAFQPGQFLHLAIDEYDPSGFWPDSRPFSIASSANDRSRVRISYAVKGQFTARMERELIEGKGVWIKLPYGDFIVDGENLTALIAGGTGITPFYAFLDELNSELSTDIYLFYGARSLDLLIYREMLSEIARSVSCFHPHYFVETPHNLSAKQFEVQPEIGPLAIETIWSRLPNPLQTTFYLSGPPAMLKTFSVKLQAFQVPLKQIRIDAWE